MLPGSKEMWSFRSSQNFCCYPSMSPFLAFFFFLLETDYLPLWDAAAVCMSSHLDLLHLSCRCVTGADSGRPSSLRELVTLNNSWWGHAQFHLVWCPVDAGLEAVLGHSFKGGLSHSHTLLFSLSRCPGRGGGMVEDVGPGKVLSLLTHSLRIKTKR